MIFQYIIIFFKSNNTKRLQRDIVQQLPLIFWYRNDSFSTYCFNNEPEPNIILYYAQKKYE